MKRAAPQHGRGASAATLQEWVKLAMVEVTDLVDLQMAVPAPELLARLSEHGVLKGDKLLQLDPDVPTEATTQLRGLGVIGEWDHATKGGLTVPLWVPGDWTGRATYVQRALRRKGMLYARYRRLAGGYMGDAGETILRRSLGDAGRHLVPIVRGFGEVRELLGVPLFGPLDSAATLVVYGDNGVPGVCTVRMEMKNRRLTLYPIHKECHQLLAKAAALQVAHPDHLIVPVLVCRRAHPGCSGWRRTSASLSTHPAGSTPRCRRAPPRFTSSRCVPSSA